MTVEKLALDNIAKTYGNVPALADINLTVAEGEFVTLLGPSGSGKSTLLKLVAGMISATSGTIRINGRDATDLPSRERDLGMVFQNYTLFPHMTVFDNVAFPLSVRRWPKAEIRTKVMRALDVVQLGQFVDRKPAMLSGGQQQRVAIARAIVYDPSLILMDEPLGALDRKLREEMQTEIKGIHEQLGITVLYVTHDQQEAMSMSDRVVVMNHGGIAQIGTPNEVYFSPSNRFVAQFLGESNFFPIEGCASELMVRPEHIIMTGEKDAPAAGAIGGHIADIAFLGFGVRYHCTLSDGSKAIVLMPGNAGSRFQRGQKVFLSWPQSEAVRFEGDVRVGA